MRRRRTRIAPPSMLWCDAAAGARRGWRTGRRRRRLRTTRCASAALVAHYASRCVTRRDPVACSGVVLAFCCDKGRVARDATAWASACLLRPLVGIGPRGCRARLSPPTQLSAFQLIRPIMSASSARSSHSARGNTSGTRAHSNASDIGAKYTQPSPRIATVRALLRKLN